MAESAVQSTAAWLGKLLVEEAKYLYDVREKVEELQGELEWMQCFLSDADKRQHKDAVIRKWISQIKDLAYDAEDVVEKFIHRVSYKDRDRGFWSNLRWLSGLLRDARALHEIGTDIDGLTRKISKLTSRLQTYGVKTRYEEISASAADPRTLELRRTYSHFEDDMIVGIDNDIASLAHQLVVDRNEGGCNARSVAAPCDANGDRWIEISNGPRFIYKKNVVVISGMGGLGKTTLARKVYHHPDVRGHFSGFAWAHISQQFQTRSVLIGILHQIIPETDTDRRDNIKDLQDAQLPGELFQVLKEKSYLVVLDDMWEPDDWLRLQAAFPVTDPSTGSKIVVTTRKRDILSSLGSWVLNHEPKLLDPIDGMKLLRRKAFATTEGDAGAVDSDMIKLEKEMLEHCQGLPLAITVLGAVLATKKTLEEWQTVNNNIRLYLGGGMAHDKSYRQVYNILAMSYYDLPYYLKPCFLHLGNFPEDYEIYTKKLYHMWIAEGIVVSSSDRTLGQSSLEEEAQCCLNELVQKCMVQVGKVGSKGKIKTCRLHDLMRDICLEIAKEENFICVMDLNQTNQNEPLLVLNERLRRLAIHIGEEGNVFLPDPSFVKAPNIRSLLFFPKRENYSSSMRSVCNNFQVLRVLDLNGFKISPSLPKEIGNLIYLRFLSLNQTQLSKVPSSIGNLSYLEILDLRVSSYTTLLPNVLWKLRRLRHLYLPLVIISGKNTFLLGYEIKRGQMMRLDGLQYLETLKNVHLDTVEVKGLLELRNMKKLTASCDSKKENLDSVLKSSNIKRLSLKINGSIMNKDQMILSSCQVLYKLEIFGGMRGPLCLEMFPTTLVMIRLQGCTSVNDPMPVFECLPQLKTLFLKKFDFGDKMECSAGGFPQLTYLSLSGLSHLREWKVGSGAFPNLEKMEIYRCYQILVLPDGLPSCVKITCNPCVKGIEKYDSCPIYKGQFGRDQ